MLKTFICFKFKYISIKNTNLLYSQNRLNISIIEHHFNLNSNFNYQIVNINLDENFYNQYISALTRSGLPSYINNNLDNYNTDLDKDSLFLFIKDIPFTSFFKTHLIDVPRCFKKTKSLRRKSELTKPLKFVNYFMIKGFKQKTLNTLMRSLDTIKSTLPHLINPTPWKLLFLFFTSNILINRRVDQLFIENPDYGEEESNYHNLENYTLLNSYNQFFFKKLKSLEPLFLFYIYKVDKSIFKNSRGRSGKFTFIWKYITPYKRSLIVYHWLAKELRIINKRNFQSRLDFLIKQVIFSKNSTWIYKIRKFSYNYVYYNCKSTLARTYKTTTR